MRTQIVAFKNLTKKNNDLEIISEYFCYEKNIIYIYLYSDIEY